ncbi:MAG: biopolymer transporter ExbD, partial [Rhodoferax sp.]|nr:biopolymer transporter ExbD [Rhodoferax sp.]
SKLSVMELALPAATAPGLEQLKAEDLQLEIVLRADALEVGDRIGGLIQRIPAVDKAPDGKVLLALLQTIKQKFPEEVQASLLAESDTPYEHIVKVMDVSREAQFPEIAVGDAPVRKPK